ncbi:hypothetical protein, partial [Mesorhizobium sp.]|uniref:hypothetical protein n=1 Tax=Mesorhizobium sp. TaxID=1871066 RepID=UPI0025C6EC93
MSSWVVGWRSPGTASLQPTRGPTLGLAVTFRRREMVKVPTPYYVPYGETSLCRDASSNHTLMQEVLEAEMDEALGASKG